MTYVFLFPGQGAQKAGMGCELAEIYPVAAEIFQKADEILGFQLSKLCFEGTDEDLTPTEVTQPALFTTSVATLSVLAQKGVHPEAAAGHSVGEYAALVAAGAIDFEDGLRVVRLRGELMAAAVAGTPGAMAAIIGLEAEDVESICHEVSALGVAEPSNLNAPTQIVISGQTEAIVQAMEEAKERGGKAIRLNVSAPFHCSLMAPVSQQLRPAIEAMTVRPPQITVVANATARPVTTPDEIRQALVDQIESPVRWVETMRYFLDHGRRSFLEVGPGKVLAGLARSIDRQAAVTPISTPNDIDKLIAE